VQLLPPPICDRYNTEPFEVWKILQTWTIKVVLDWSASIDVRRKGGIMIHMIAACSMCTRSTFRRPVCDADAGMVRDTGTSDDCLVFVIDPAEVVGT
jgi:hypothetical protein